MFLSERRELVLVNRWVWARWTRLGLLHAGLDESQIIGLEAHESAERPLALVVLVRVVVGALLDLCTDLSLVAGLSQLLHQVLNISALLLVEQTHLVQDALHVACIGLLELPLLEFFHLLRWDVQLSHALLAVSGQILTSLDAPIGVGLNGRWERESG